MKPESSKLFFALGATAFASTFVTLSLERGFLATPAPSVSVPTVTEQSVVRQEDQVVDTVKRVEPAVVSVIITKDLPKVQRSQSMDDFPFNDPFFRQFGIQVPLQQQDQGAGGTVNREVGGGSAFFVSSDGLLMTNKHVVDDENAQYTVLLNDGKKVTAKVVGMDPLTDIALLKIDGSSYPYLQIASSDDVNLGQTAIAIGNALGEFRNTVSVGVISGLQRSITAGGSLGGNVEHLDQILQTDAAINEGNSGGPLLNSLGYVIGMNTAVAGDGQNIGFALPAKELRRVLENYEKNGRIVRPYIGVRYIPITAELKQANKLPYDYGMLVAAGQNTNDLAVIPGSPADKAGIVENDIILEADGQKLSQDNSLQQIIGGKSVGDTVTFKVYHKGSQKTVTVTLEEMKA